MKNKTYCLNLSKAEIDQLLWSVEYIEREGVGYSPLNYFDKRLQNLKKALNHAMLYNGDITFEQYNSNLKQK